MKRTRSVQKDQQMGHLTMTDSSSDHSFRSNSSVHNHKPNSLFNVPGLYVGSIPKVLSDCDSVRSPTSPLEFRVFSNLGISNNYPKLLQNGQQKRSWNSGKVGLSIVDSLEDNHDDKIENGCALRSLEAKNVIFRPQAARIKNPSFANLTNSFEESKSLPRNFAILPRTHTKSTLRKGRSNVLFEIGDAPFESEAFGKPMSFSLDSLRSVRTLPRFANHNNGTSATFNESAQLNFTADSNKYLPLSLTSAPISIESGNGFAGSLSASEIELSEDYTCVISHGPNPKKTHIYGDCILEGYSSESKNLGTTEGKNTELTRAVTDSNIPSPFPYCHFLSFCNYCGMRLKEEEDIYIYREKAFCSLSCRSEEMMIDEEMENMMEKSSEDGEGISEAAIFDAP